MTSESFLTQIKSLNFKKHFVRLGTGLLAIVGVFTTVSVIMLFPTWVFVFALVGIAAYVFGMAIIEAIEEFK